MKGIKTNIDEVRWDLSPLYAGPEDPQINRDLEKLTALAHDFNQRFHNQLDQKLEDALRVLIDLEELSNKIGQYFFLANTENTNDPLIKTTMAVALERITALSAENLSFFNLELARLDQAAIEQQIEGSDLVRRHRPYIEDIRRLQSHMMSEEVESALSRHSLYEAGSWTQFCWGEESSELRFAWKGQKLGLTEIKEYLEDRDPETRRQAHHTISQGLAGHYARLSAHTLYVVAASKRASDLERGYPHYMAQRNLLNKVDDDVIESLHKAVAETAVPIAKRYYRLKSRLLGMKRLHWADRNASVNLSSLPEYDYDEARRVILQAMRDFSPLAADLAYPIFDGQSVDVHPRKNKADMVYCSFTPIPDNQTLTYIMLNFKGGIKDVLVLGHEVGHGIHFKLSHQAQGSLMWEAPLAYMETASVFNEMVTYRFLQQQLAEQNNERGQLELAMAFSNSLINSTVRQISFSEFEQQLHQSSRRLSVDELNANWLQITEKYYGRNGEIFDYEDMNNLWATINHFRIPFYLYSYPFGQLLTASLFAVRDQIDGFEEKYLNLLRAGSTKGIVDLLAPFGLDPHQPDFWNQGIKASLGETVQLAENLANELGL